MISFQQFLLEIAEFQRRVHKNPSLQTIKNVASSNPNKLARFTIDHNKNIFVGDANVFHHGELGDNVGSEDNDQHGTGWIKDHGDHHSYYRYGQVKNVERFDKLKLTRYHGLYNLKGTKHFENESLREGTAQHTAFHNTTVSKAKAIAQASKSQLARFVYHPKTNSFSVGDAANITHDQLGDSYAAKTVKGNLWHKGDGIYHHDLGTASEYSPESNGHKVIQHFAGKGIYYHPDVIKKLYDNNPDVVW